MYVVHALFFDVQVRVEKTLPILSVEIKSQKKLK